MNLRYILTTVLFYVLSNSLLAQNQNVEVLVTGIRSAEGRIVIGVYKSNEDFRKDNTCMREKFSKNKMVDGNLLVVFNLLSGTYGFSLLDDENDDDKMNFSFIGIPKEGYAFSNYYHSSLSRPDFELFKVDVTKGESKRVTMKMKYML